ncbi:hypothetical protein [Streptomyces althioticus]|uniref:hypothetical protein n=1 Tax=Streptomyces althioticus TaxID=83380 RepID=UPI003684EE60
MRSILFEDVRQERELIMASGHPPVTEDDPSVAACFSDQVGRCASCNRRTHGYGHGGNPLCSYCFTDQEQRSGGKCVTSANGVNSAFL